MTKQISRRAFLGGSFAVAAAGGILGTPKLAMAKSSPQFSYGPVAGIAKLNANENPYGPSPAAIKAAAEATVKGGAYYAGSARRYLTDMIAEKFGLKAANVSISSGSSGVLSYAAIAASAKGKILGPDLFWDTTARAPERQGNPVIKRLDKTADLSIDLDAMYAAIDDDVAMVHVVNPNNPTGTVLDTQKLREFCIKASKKTLVLVDEAYNELTDNPDARTMAPLINEGHNIIVARTFSKIYGMAGMRVGYMLGSEQTISWINQYGIGGYAVSQSGLAAAIASYNDDAFLSFSRSKVKEARDMVFEAVKANGLSALPSTTNFVFVNLGTGNAETFRQEMEKRNVLIRGIYRDYTPWSRVSMGRIEDVAMYVKALPAALEATMS